VRARRKGDFKKGNPGGPGHPRNADILAALLKASEAKHPLLALLGEVKNRPEGSLTLADWVRINVALAPYFHPKPTASPDPLPPIDMPELNSAADAVAFHAELARKARDGAIDAGQASMLRDAVNGFVAALSAVRLEREIVDLRRMVEELLQRESPKA
jgi:hypothetical protein